MHRLLHFSCCIVEQCCEQIGILHPTLPRKRRAPACFEVGSGEGFHSETVEDHFRRQYFEVLIASITKRFDQLGYRMYKNLEDLLVTAANGKEIEAYLKTVTAFYRDDFDSSLLSAQLQNLATHFDGNTVTLRDCIAFLRGLSSAQRYFFSEVCMLAHLIIVMPATNAVSERSFSAMRRLKTYLCSTMSQRRLNHLLLNINREKADRLDIDCIADEFVRGSQHRLSQFGKFMF